LFSLYILYLFQLCLIQRKKGKKKENTVQGNKGTVNIVPQLTPLICKESEAIHFQPITNTVSISNWFSILKVF